ncbi:unnamed protein product [Meganyctiphanes norvegica]|uniref:Uncharacterized protein n=1 Tax=Meganyctiphanes norvegica TaxID=48144 RepID=A0AAV2STV0_MEGNR
MEGKDGGAIEPNVDLKTAEEEEVAKEGMLSKPNPSEGRRDSGGNLGKLKPAEDEEEADMISKTIDLGTPGLSKITEVLGDSEVLKKEIGGNQGFKPREMANFLGFKGGKNADQTPEEDTGNGATGEDQVYRGQYQGAKSKK